MSSIKFIDTHFHLFDFKNKDMKYEHFEPEFIHPLLGTKLQKLSESSYLIENYLDDLKRFTLMRKNIPLNNTESVLLGEFEYDFKSIHKSEYYLNPNSISKLKTPIQLKFFHTNKQQKHITNQQKLYSSHALGLGRMLQQTNLNLVFRSFERDQ